MKKIAFTFGCLFILFGILTVIITSILNKVIPKLGYVAYQAAAAGSYSEDLYKMDFSFLNTLSVIMIISGIVIGIYLRSHDK